MDVSISVLREMRNDRLRWSVAAKPEVLVVEHIPAIAHQVSAAVALDGVYAVFARLKQRVQLEILLVLVAGIMIVDELRSLSEMEFREIAAQPYVAVRDSTLTPCHCGSPTRFERWKVKDRLRQVDRRQCVDVKRGARVLVLLRRLGRQLDIRRRCNQETARALLWNTEGRGVQLPERRDIATRLQAPRSRIEKRYVLLPSALHSRNVLHQEEARL